VGLLDRATKSGIHASKLKAGRAMFKLMGYTLLIFGSALLLLSALMVWGRRVFDGGIFGGEKRVARTR
jgi:hypothetical protein